MEARQGRSSVPAIMIVGSSIVVGVLAWLGVCTAFWGGGSGSAGASWLFGFGAAIFFDASEVLPVRHRARGTKLVMLLIETAVLAGLLWLVWSPPSLFGNKEFSIPWSLFGLLVGVFIIVLTRKVIGVLSARRSMWDDNRSPYLGTADRSSPHGYFGSRGDK